MRSAWFGCAAFEAVLACIFWHLGWHEVMPLFAFWAVFSIWMAVWGQPSPIGDRP